MSNNKNRNKNRNNSKNINKNKNINRNTNVNKNTNINKNIREVEEEDVFDDNMMFNMLGELEDEPEIKEIQEKIEEPVKDVVADCRRVLRKKQKDEPETTMLEDFKKNRILWAILFVLLIVLVVVLILTNVGKDDNKKDTETETTTKQEETSDVTEENTGIPTPEASDSEITTLVRNFLRASKIEASMDEIAKYVDSTENMSAENYESIKKYIEDFKNLECYKINSIDENTFVVVATFGCKFYNIETAAPGCETYIVIKKDNEYKIHNLTKQETLESYISSDIDVTIINQINKEVNDSLKTAIESDEELEKVVDILRQ